MCRWVMLNHLHMHQGVSCLRGKTDDHDILLWCHNHSDYVIWQLHKKIPTEALGIQFQLGFGGEGHKLSVPAILVSYMEKDY